MKNIFGLLLIIIVAIACSKKSDPPPPPEAPIAFDLDAAAINNALGSSFGFNVTLTSAMPSTSGIRIEVTAIEEGTGTSLTQNAAIVSTVTKTAATVIGLPIQKWVIVTVKVISVKTSTNSLSKTFRVVFK